jgi:hypothetical protein
MSTSSEDSDIFFFENFILDERRTNRGRRKFRQGITESPGQSISRHDDETSVSSTIGDQIVVTRPFEPFFALLSTPTPSARFLVLTVGHGWHWRPRIRSVNPFEFCLVACPGLDIYTVLMRINY